MMLYVRALPTVRWASPVIRLYRNIFSSLSNKKEEDKDSLVTIPTCHEAIKTPCFKECLDKSIKSPTVIIVGAGIAGLSAAQRLGEYGINDITILEATNRIGGRVYTCTFDEHPVDLGAHWIRGASISNAIFNMAMQDRLLTSPVNIVDPFRGIFALSDGTPVCKDLRAKSLRILRTILCNVKELVNDPEQLQFHINHSVWDYFLNHVELETAGMKERDIKTIRSILLAVMNCLSGELGADLCQIPVERLACNRNCLGGDTYLKGGFKTILESMTSCVAKENIKLGKEVCSIKWSNTTPDEGRVSVKTCDECVYNGDFVIVTVSLGVLKMRHEALFCPHLPSDKVNAIQQIGFGNINKVFLSYKKPFWVPGEGCIRVCWNVEELLEAKSEWTRSIGLIEEAPENPRVLTFTIGGPAARCVEEMTEKSVAEHFTKLIHSVLNNGSLPAPSQIIRSRWRSDRFFYGAASYFTNETHLSHMSTLADGLPHFGEAPAPTVLFAGEATIPGMNGTAHGARLSGVREAEKIVEITKRFGGAPPRHRTKVGLKT